MRFLLVNGYNATVQNAKLFQDFRSFIQKTISGMPEVADTDCEYYSRDRNQLDDFLYEPESSLIRLESGLKFDSLDMVFIIAAPNVKPWNANMRKLVTLTRMCLKTKKLLFVTTFGTQTLAYLCASNLNDHISVTNNNGEGCKLVNFPKFTMNALNNGHNDYFLDSTTGDLYAYSKSTDEWIPRVNVGIHCRRDAMEFQSIGRYVVKSPTYRPKSQQIDYENMCVIRKPFLHHWLFKNVNQEFSVNLQSSWDIHTFTFTNPERKFTTLADNNIRGPLILECFNVIGLMFEVELHRKDTSRILFNFIDNGIRVIKFQNGYNTQSIANEKLYNLSSPLENIELVFQKKERSGCNGNPEELKKIQQKQYILEYRKLLNKGIQESNSKDKIFHVGYSVKKDRLPDYVQDNYIAQKHFKVHREKSFNQKKDQLLKQFKIDLETSPSQRRVQISHTRSTSLRRIKKYADAKSKISYDNPSTPHTLTKYMMDDCIEEESDEQLGTITQAFVRKTLHPTLGDQYLGKEKIWVPGLLKQRIKMKQEELISARLLKTSILHHLSD